MQGPTNLSDDALLHELHAIVGSHRHVTAELILHLGEVDARRLHVDKGFPSLFSYCVQLLHFSEDEACRRIDAARLARRFPAIHALLETGAVSLTVLGLLKPHLTEDNHQDLLTGVSRASVRHAKEWLAARFPQPDVPWSIRKRPERRLPAESVPSKAGLDPRAPLPASARAAQGEPAVAALPASARARVEPLSGDGFLVKFTASRRMKEKLEHASDLMRHVNPAGELSVILERAVDLLIAELEKKKQGKTHRPKLERAGEPSRVGLNTAPTAKTACRATRREQRPGRESNVSRAARREVVERQGWRCAFVAADGRRCDARGFLEFDHEIPTGCGGGSEATNLRILCRAHNRLAAERVYGEAHVSRAIASRPPVPGLRLPPGLTGA